MVSNEKEKIKKLIISRERVENRAEYWELFLFINLIDEWWSSITTVWDNQKWFKREGYKENYRCLKNRS